MPASLTLPDAKQYNILVDSDIVFKVPIGKLKVGFSSIHPAQSVSIKSEGYATNKDNSPSGFIIEESVSALFKLLRDILGLFMSLEPGLILLVKPPALILQRLCCQILLISTLFVIKDIEECVGLDTRV